MTNIVLTWDYSETGMLCFGEKTSCVVKDRSFLGELKMNGRGRGQERYKKFFKESKKAGLCWKDRLYQNIVNCGH